MSNFFIRTPLESECYQLADTFTRSFMVPLDSIQQEELAQKFKAQIQNKVVFFLVAEENEQMVGLGGESRYRGCSFIGWLGVNPHRRKLGIGSALFQRLLEQATVYNPTVELFSNLGIENLYRRFGFEDQFHAHIFELSKQTKVDNSDVKTVIDRIPQWIYELDQRIMGFDRSVLLKLLIETLGARLVYLEPDGYAIQANSNIGPLITKDVDVAKSLINQLLVTGSKRIISPTEFESEFKKFSPKRVQTCLKMTYGRLLLSEVSWIWGFHSFATG
ncbi:MAG: GNAT family N-acetyltransferase [Promethearchaeota archaeon]